MMGKQDIANFYKNNITSAQDQIAEKREELDDIMNYLAEMRIKYQDLTGEWCNL